MRKYALILKVLLKVVKLHLDFSSRVFYDITRWSTDYIDLKTNKLERNLMYSVCSQCVLCAVYTMKYFTLSVSNTSYLGHHGLSKLFKQYNLIIFCCWMSSRYSRFI